MVASYILQLLSFDEVNVWIFEKEKKKFTDTLRAKWISFFISIVN